ncbi:MAG: radical SAM protein [Candidatus Aminicenantes bacterium]|nr:radical SAM protein [Acidobacteriota bacterium]MBU4404837.1 radical SAM protein [Acidobacteriota bacterium]MCG2812595.1 radical SAM protein [Candidatus Aminicenantes bacterium]
MTIEKKHKTQHIFGPVPSRRLGISLGVDIIPYKTCSLDCLYCECGRTTRLTCERQSFFPPQLVMDELNMVLAGIPHLDFITFSGSGEPTLNSDLGWLSAEIKKTSAVPLAVLTNGTLLYREDVRQELQQADVVLPSLDAATASAFARINQPCTGLEVERIIAGMEIFRREYPGKIWLEIFIVKGINDKEEEIAALGQAVRRIAPDKIQLNTLDRPPAYSGIEFADFSVLEKIRDKWSDLPVEIIKRANRREEIPAFSSNLENSLLNTIRRRPLTLDDLAALTAKGESELRQYLDILEKEKKIRPVIVGERIFYTAV